MIAREINKELVREAFEKMLSKEDLLRLLNYVKGYVYGERSVPFELKQLTWYANPKISGKRYVEFAIKKKSGDNRYINAPVSGLKAIQKTLAVIFQCVFDPHQAAMGFVKGKSILNNASLHQGSNYVYNIDLRDFFSSIDQARVWKCLQLRPFNLSSSKGTSSPSRLHLANIIASLCCTEMLVERKNSAGKWEMLNLNVLPQGAPTSPIITNVICQRLDYLLSAVAKRFGLKYSRYVDDITFSSMHNVYLHESEFLKELNRIIGEQNFNIKASKTRLQKKGFRQEVTGLIVNEKVNVQKRYIKQLRMWLYYWERYGYDKSQTIFAKHYLADKGHVKKKDINMGNVLSGKLDYLKMIKGKNNATFLKLYSTFARLSNMKNKYIPTAIHEKKEKDVKLSEVETVDNVRKKVPNAVQLPFLHTPVEVVNILKKFGDSNTTLKYTTHSWDFGRDVRYSDYAEYLEQIKKEFNEFREDLKLLKPVLFKKLENFLTRDLSEGLKNYWGTHLIKFGWSNRELVNAMQADTSLLPKNFQLPEYARKDVDGKLISSFGDVIDIFKKEIEVRGETNRLYNTIGWFSRRLAGDFNVVIDQSLFQKTFYTDTQWFEKGISEIFDSIRSLTQYPNINVSAKDNPVDKTLTIEILQLESNCKFKSFKDPKFQLQSGGFGNIFEAFKNLCDWSIETEFSEGHHRLNYLVSNKDLPFATNLVETSGFKHILTFYR